MHIFLSSNLVQKYHKISTKKADIFFDFSIPSHGGPIKINKITSRTVLSHLRTEIFPKIVYFWKKQKQFFGPQILISLFYHKETRYRLTGPLITMFYLICGPRCKKMHIFFSSNLAQTYHKTTTKIADLFLFLYSITWGPIKINKTPSRTVLSHLWTEIFPQTVYFWTKKKKKKKKKTDFFVLKILLSLFYHMGPR